MIEDDIKIAMYHGENLFHRDSDLPALIEGYLWERDVIMLLGSEKSGKSILALQWCCNLSTGTPFLGKYQTKKSFVAYLQTEGKKDETPVRLENIGRSLSIDPTHFVRLYRKFLPIDIKEYREKLEEVIVSFGGKLQVLFIDCLYMAMAGDLNENKEIRFWIACLSELAEKHKLTIVVVHHCKREEFFEGRKLQLGDKASYGSVFLRANVDHIIFLDMNKDKTRTLTCDTQRSGKVAEKEDLVLIQPSPLLFKIKTELLASDETILFNLLTKPMGRGELSNLTRYSESTIDKSIRTLIGLGYIELDGTQSTESGQSERLYKPLKGGLSEKHL